MNQSTQIKGFFEVSKGTLIKNEKYGKCYKCKQPYISEEKWCNHCDTERYKFFYKHIFKYLKIKKFEELSSNERSRFKQFGLCYECFQPYTEKEWCDDCDTKRFNIKYDDELFQKYKGKSKFEPTDFKMKNFEELSSNERSRFKQFGLCYECFQPYTEKEWCDDCDTKRFNIKYDDELFQKYKGKSKFEPTDFKMKNFEELSSNERSRFKQFGLCYECFQPYTEKEWCDDCVTKSFLKESKTIGYYNDIHKLSKKEKKNFKRFGFCHNCKQIKINKDFCKVCSEWNEFLVANYGKCKKCRRPYTPEENYDKWCDICDTNLFLEVSKKTIGYFKQPTKLSKDRKEQLEKYRGLCPDCEEPNTGWAWCNKCDPGRFLREGKISGNTEMDKLIYESQCRAEHYNRNLEWIPFDRFKDINQIGEGGFAKVYSATWLDGRPKVLDGKKSRSNSIIIALKEIKNSNNMTNIFINEIKTHYKFQRFYNDSLIQFYGITKDPKTENFMLVLEYADNGSIKDYIKSNYLNLKWKDKLNILYCTSKNLQTIHKLQYVHRDLHSGNVVNFSNSDWEKKSKITDLGLTHSLLLNNSNSSNIYGVLPYIAPEILNGKPYTTASDIYSFGIIMVELSTGKPPFGNVPHNKKLAMAICNGLRPCAAKGTPQCYIDLANQCLDANPKDRPSPDNLCYKINSWRDPLLYSYYMRTLGENEFIKADNNISQESLFKTTIHPKAVYSSRSFNFSHLPKPKNSRGVRIENQKVSDAELVKHFFEDNIEELQRI